MKLDFEGRTWQLELEDATVSQTVKIMAYTGLPSLMSWYKSITGTEDAGWLKSMQCLYWLMKAQNGADVDLATADFAPLRLFQAFGAASRAEAEAAAEGEPDPTRPAAGPAAEEPMPSPATSPG